MITVKDILKIADIKFKYANIDENTSFSSVVIDSRKVTPGCLFIAIKGAKFDGHDFISEVLEKGAGCVVVKKTRFSTFASNGAPVIGAPDTVTALGSIAGAWRDNLGATIIGITGSNGKTTTKDMVATILATKYRTVATTANNNNHIGVPLTLFEAGAQTEFVVCEIGTNHFGEIRYSANIAKPDIATITNIGDSHLEFLIDRRGVKTEKEALLQVTVARGGKVILDCDDKFLNRMVRIYPDAVTVSMRRPKEVTGKILNYSEAGLPLMKIESGGKSVKFELGLYGKKNCDNALIAAAIALQCGMTLAEIGEGFKNVKAPKGRMNRTTHNGFDILDDTYNANPESMKSAFWAVRNDLIHERKIAILGDMFELGENAVQMHIDLMTGIKLGKFHTVFLTGKHMKHLYAELKKQGITAAHFATKEKMIEMLANYDLRNSLILVKGSRGMQMEVIVNYLKEKGI